MQYVAGGDLKLYTVNTVPPIILRKISNANLANRNIFGRVKFAYSIKLRMLNSDAIKFIPTIAQFIIIFGIFSESLLPEQI